MALRPRWLKRAMRNTLASMIPQAKLQPSAPRSMVRTWIVSAVTTPRVKVKVSAIIKPNRTSEILSIGSRIRSADLAENCANGSTAIRTAHFRLRQEPMRLAPYALTTKQTIESRGSELHDARLRDATAGVGPMTVMNGVVLFRWSIPRSA